MPCWVSCCWSTWPCIASGAKNANAIIFTVGALYQGAGNKAKAIENYKKVLSDPQFGANAKQMIDALSK